ncbi:hypothetical protein HT121_04185 [Pseudomonas sp. MAFF 301514]|uniref:Uncharacterized protein n=1 Tax=Pseudomonas allii TaxID=2740531 RepID=A0A7Y8RKA4_9PSED|nr:hypothetical protein [Pseudomonas allii]NWN46891.1 hypothetical protein [Pseudomonas allii]NWN60629.1 hypothetical protein [Pseudomonas allii]
MACEYSLTDVLQRLYENQLAMEAAVMELTLWVEKQNHSELGENIRGALHVMDDNAGHIKQGLARLNIAIP